MYKLSKHQLRKFLGGTIFSAEFIKKNGEVRKIHCRLGVKAYTNGKGLSYNQANYNYLTVYDLQKKAYRTLNVDTLLKVNARNKNYLVL
jgi:hypothetical protein